MSRSDVLLVSNMLSQSSQVNNQGVQFRFFGQMFVDHLLDFAFYMFDTRQHVFGIRSRDLGDERVCGLISHEIYANMALLVCLFHHIFDPNMLTLIM